MDTGPIVAPIQELIPAVPEPQSEVTPALVGPQETKKEVTVTDIPSAEKTDQETSQSEGVSQSDIMSNPESKSEDNVITIKTTESQLEPVLDTADNTETASQSELTVEPAVNTPETPLAEPVSGPMEDIKRD